jgi:hypothetical protein
MEGTRGSDLEFELTLAKQKIAFLEAVLKSETQRADFWTEHAQWLGEAMLSVTQDTLGEQERSAPVKRKRDIVDEEPRRRRRGRRDPNQTMTERQFVNLLWNSDPTKIGKRKK